MSAISLKVEFSGGLELLFNNQRSHTISIPAFVPLDNSTRPVSAPTQIQTDGHDATGEKLKQADMIYLIHYLRDHLLKERVELFVENGTVRPGILVLINDTDWELEGEGEYVLKDGDDIVFISTLHGG